ncbi:hypothetical protein [Kitasatospora mediocidica]|uniref:hypothetical protein n=1 Tax=Kitasatospora mediocidica TaxID=58352 RepID=UPI0005602399|nr:hypothetical protein [Kitasatospora mediocidica]
MSTRSRLSGGSLLCLALAIGASGCSSAKPAAAPAPVPSPTVSAAPSASPSTSASASNAALSADQLRDQSLRDLLSPGTVTVDLNSGAAGKSLTSHVAYDMGAGNILGTITPEGEGSFGLVRHGATAWVKPDTTFWQVLGGKDGALAAQKFDGHYLSGRSDDNEFQSLVKAFALDSVIQQYISVDDHATLGAPTTVDGQQALTLTLDHVGTPTTILVAAEGKPHPLKLTHGTDTLSFHDYGTPVVVQEPSADQVVSLDDVRKLGAA